VLQLFLILVTLQRNPSSIDEFRSIRAFQCDFGGGGGGHIYEDGGGNTNEERLITSPPYMYDDARDLIFDSIDYRTLRARSVTKNSPVAVTVIPGERLVSFLEVTPEGVPIITSILRTPRPLDHRLNNTYHVVRSYQLLISENGDKSYQLEGACKPRQ
jgi:hypothetical protein